MSASDQGHSSRTEKTRQCILTAAQRLFLERGFQATSTDAILAEAGVSSKETLYRYFASKEELFIAVLSTLTTEQPDFSARLAALPPPRDIRALRESLTTAARDILTLMCQPSYLALWRMMMAEAPRFPQLGAAFFLTLLPRLTRPKLSGQLGFHCLCNGRVIYLLPRSSTSIAESTGQAHDHQKNKALHARRRHSGHLRVDTLMLYPPRPVVAGGPRNENPTALAIGGSIVPPPTGLCGGFSPSYLRKLRVSRITWNTIQTKQDLLHGRRRRRTKLVSI